MLNYYGSGTIKTSHAVLTQTTDYPRDSRVDIALNARSKKPFTLALRIPYWSEKTKVRLNGELVNGVKAGNYCEINRTWRKGDKLRIDFDLRPHCWVCETPAPETVPGLKGTPASIYRGPVLLAYDPQHQSADVAELPALNDAALKLRPVTDRRWRPSHVRIRFGVSVERFLDESFKVKTHADKR